MGTVRLLFMFATTALIGLACCGLAQEGKASDGGSNKSGEASGKNEQKELTPDEKMQARFPQPAKVGHLIGLPVLDGNDSTIGYVQKIVRTPEGKLKLIVPYREWFGWARDGSWLAGERRPVAVPIETVQILALQINAVDMNRSAFMSAPTWTPGQSVLLRPEETIRIAVGRR